MRAFLILAAATLAGCGTYAYPLSTDDAGQRQRVTERAAGRSVVVRVQGEPGVQAEALSVRADSTSWTDPATGTMRTISTDLLRGVRIPGSDKSSFQAAAIGIGGGLLTGAALGFVSYEFPTPLIGSRGEAAAFGSVGAGLIGGLVGLTMGRDRKSDDVFVVRRSAAAPPVQLTANGPVSADTTK